MRIFKIFSLSLLLSFSLLQNACLAEKTASQLIKEAPQDVLVGTDVKLLKTFEVSSSFLPGHYVAEMGGANLSINIESKAQSLKIIRVFQEPGLPAESKSYEIKYQDKAFIENNTLLALPIKSGVLILEKNSESSGIPMDMWVLYTKK